MQNYLLILQVNNLSIFIQIFMSYCYDALHTGKNFTLILSFILLASRSDLVLETDKQ